MNLENLQSEMLDYANSLVAKAICLLLASDGARKERIEGDRALLLDAARSVANASCKVEEWWTQNNGIESDKEEARVASELANHIREVCEGRSTISWGPLVNYASRFLTTTWLKELGVYLHKSRGEFLYFLYGDNENDLVKALVDEGSSLPDWVENWIEISSQLAEYFARSLREARTTPQARLAEISLAAVDASGFPLKVKNEIRSNANAIIAECEAKNKNEIEHLLITPKKLLNEMDGLVTSLHATKGPIDETGAILRVGKLRQVLVHLYDELETNFLSSCNG